MATIRLEINKVRLEKKRERWKLYFLIVTEVPGKPGELAITTVPVNAPLKFTRQTDNEYCFEPTGENAEGLFILETEMPADQTMRVEMYVMHSRQATRNFGTTLSKVGKLVGAESATGQVITALGGTNLWITIAQVAGQAVGWVGKALKGLKDRQLGFVHMSEAFGEEFSGQAEQVRKNGLTTGYGEVEWAWIVK